MIFRDIDAFFKVLDLLDRVERTHVEARAAAGACRADDGQALLHGDRVKRTGLDALGAAFAFSSMIRTAIYLTPFSTARVFRSASGRATPPFPAPFGEHFALALWGRRKAPHDLRRAGVEARVLRREAYVDLVPDCDVRL
jgi:hypothetical protein